MKRYSMFSLPVTYLPNSDPEMVADTGATMSGIQGSLYAMDFLYDVSQGVKYTQVQPSERGRLDLIAYRELGDFRAWYVLWQMNQTEDENGVGGIRDPIADVVPGMNIAIPTGAVSKKNFIPYTYQ